MKRLHLFEFEDQVWFPSLLRNYMTGFLRHATLKLGLDRPLVSLLQRFLDSTHQSKIIDLCSGGGGLLFPLCADLCLTPHSFFYSLGRRSVRAAHL